MPTIDLQPVLEGELVRLRPTRAGDWDGMFAAASDPLVWEVHPASDRYKEPVFRRFFDEGLASGGCLTILDRESGMIIGSSRYHGHDPAAGEIEIGWTFLARPYWGGRYNREVKRLMLGHIYGWIDTVVFLVGDTNIRSRRAMEKIGGRLRDEIRVRSDIPHLVYEFRRPALPA